MFGVIRSSTRLRHTTRRDCHCEQLSLYRLLCLDKLFRHFGRKAERLDGIETCFVRIMGGTMEGDEQCTMWTFG
jgi:hypothetical protein